MPRLPLLVPGGAETEQTQFRPAQCGARAPSPADRFVPGIPGYRPGSIAPSLPSDRAALRLRLLHLAQMDAAQTALPSTSADSDSRAPGLFRRYRVLRLPPPEPAPSPRREHIAACFLPACRWERSRRYSFF